MRGLDPEERRLIRIIVQYHGRGRYDGTEADVPALVRLHERGCVRVVRFDESRDGAVPTELGRIAARLP